MSDRLSGARGGSCCQASQKETLKEDIWRAISFSVGNSLGNSECRFSRSSLDDSMPNRMITPLCLFCQLFHSSYIKGLNPDKYYTRCLPSTSTLYIDAPRGYLTISEQRTTFRPTKDLVSYNLQYCNPEGSLSTRHEISLLHVISIRKSWKYKFQRSPPA